MPRPKRVLRKWEERDRAWRYCTESLEISIHGHIDYPKDSLFVTVRPDIGLPMTACLTKEHGFEIVRQYCRRLYEELLE